MLTDDIDIYECTIVEAAVKLIQTEAPDLLLLDIELTDGNGFDLLNQIITDKLDVIFVTGFDNHAIKAIKVGALDYILKPVDEQELVDAIKTAIDRSSIARDLKKLVEISSDYFKGAQVKRIVLKTLDNFHIVDEDDISFCQSDGSYTVVHIKGSKKVTVSKSLKKVTELLTDNKFVRCHQSYVVNKNEVVRYNKQGYLALKSDEMVPVSGRRKDFVLSQLF